MSQHASREQADSGWPTWGKAVEDALTSQNISTNAAAARLDVRNVTLRRWLDGKSPPRLALLPDFAALTGLSHAYQLSLGGVLPKSLRSDAHTIQVAAELRNAVGTVEQLLSRAAELAYADAGARLAGILLGNASGLQITLRRAYRGARHPIHLSTYVGVDTQKQDDVEDLRQLVTQIVGEYAGAFGASWREQDAHDWKPPRPRLILNVPQHERPRAPIDIPLTAAPNFLMLGCPYSHAEYVGALIAESLGYGYHDLRYSVSPPLDRAPTDPYVTEARIRYTKTLLRDERLTTKYVSSITDHRVIPNVIDELRESDIACVIYIRSQDRLLERGAEVWGIKQDEIRDLRDVLDQLVAESPWPAIIVSMPDELLSEDPEGPIVSDRIADISVMIAADVWRVLTTHRLVPRGDSALGTLRGFFDDQGRSKNSSELRAPLVNSRLRMPPRAHTSD
ncbi:hypothetical protein V3G39_17875 (plasmid) [Dermatophilaceae bacterium Sec6.4]